MQVNTFESLANRYEVNLQRKEAQSKRLLIEIKKPLSKAALLLISEQLKFKPLNRLSQPVCKFTQ